MKNATLPSASRQLSPVSGTVKVLQPIGTVGPVCNRTGELSINGKPCLCKVHATGYTLYGFDTKKGEATVYDLPSDLSSCDCADATYRADRPEGCKHRKALTALRAAGKLPACEALADLHGDAEADALCEAWAGSEAA